MSWSKLFVFCATSSCCSVFILASLPAVYGVLVFQGASKLSMSRNVQLLTGFTRPGGSRLTTIVDGEIVSDVELVCCRGLQYVRQNCLNLVSDP